MEDAQEVEFAHRSHACQPVKIKALIGATLHVAQNAADAPLILRFVTNYVKSEPEAEVTVVGYASGIDFMLKDAKDSDGKAYAAQVNRLLDMGVMFKVCNNTLKARNASPDVVLASVGIVPSAVNEIVRLQTQDGYSYFRH